MSERIRVFCGTPGSNEDLECQCVFEYSLRKYHPQDNVDIHWMMLSREPRSFWYANPQAKPKEGWNTFTWATPFSALRWGIPAACDFKGKAIYCDCDQFFIADVAELWNQEIPEGKALLKAKVGDCVMLMDNERMGKILPPVEELKKEGVYRSVRKTISKHAGLFEGEWNCLDGKDEDKGNFRPTIYDGKVKLLHYTHIPTQPNHRHARARLKAEGKEHWYKGADEKHPCPEVTELFDRMLEEAIAVGKGPETFRMPVEFGDYGRGIK